MATTRAKGYVVAGLLLVVSGSKLLLIKGGVGEDCRYREGRRPSLSLRKGFAGRSFEVVWERNWLLRELKATSLRAFFLLRQVASPSLSKEGLGRIVGIRDAEGHPSLYAKGLQGGLLRWFGRGIGYCASRWLAS